MGNRPFSQRKHKEMAYLGGKSSTSLAIKEIQIKSTVKTYCFFPKQANIFFNEISPQWKGTCKRIFITAGGGQTAQVFGEAI